MSCAFRSPFPTGAHHVPFGYAALEDLIKADPSSRRGRGRGRGGAGRKRVSRGGATGATNAAKAVTSTSRAQRTAAANASRPPVVIPGRGGGPSTGSKIIMSNLPLDVTEAQVRVSVAAVFTSVLRFNLSRVIV